MDIRIEVSSDLEDDWAATLDRSGRPLVVFNPRLGAAARQSVLQALGLAAMPQQITATRAEARGL